MLRTSRGHVNRIGVTPIKKITSTVIVLQGQQRKVTHVGFTHRHIWKKIERYRWEFYSVYENVTWYSAKLQSVVCKTAVLYRKKSYK